VPDPGIVPSIRSFYETSTNSMAYPCFAQMAAIAVAEAWGADGTPTASSGSLPFLHGESNFTVYVEIPVR
jgi:hypothetical protein